MIQIIEKQAEIPMRLGQLQFGLAYRLVVEGSNCKTDNIALGDICLVLPSETGENTILNCTKNLVIYRRNGWLDDLRFCRAFFVHQIVFSSDNEPRPAGA